MSIKFLVAKDEGVKVPWFTLVRRVALTRGQILDPLTKLYVVCELHLWNCE